MDESTLDNLARSMERMKEEAKKRSVDELLKSEKPERVEAWMVQSGMIYQSPLTSVLALS